MIIVYIIKKKEKEKDNKNIIIKKNEIYENENENKEKIIFNFSNDNISIKQDKNNNIDNISNNNILNGMKNNTNIYKNNENNIENNINKYNNNNIETNVNNLNNINIYNQNERQINGIKQNNYNENDNTKNNIEDNKNNIMINTEKKDENQGLPNNSNTNNNISQNTKQKNYIISEFLKSKNLKVKTYTENINHFSKDFYDVYYQLIPSQIKEMFKTQNNIVPNLLKGISPYLIILYEELPGGHNNWLSLKNNIFGICTINYEYKKNKLKIIINHISTSFEINEEKNKYYLNDIKHIFGLIIKYIKKEFYFDEIIIEYDSNKVCEDILNIFLFDFNFTLVNETDRDINEDEENTENNNKIKEEQENKLVYVNDSTNNRINDMIRQSALSYFEKNILNIFNSVLITNNFNYSSTLEPDTNRTFHNINNKKKLNKTFNEINIKNNLDDDVINIICTNYLLEVKEETNIKRFYNKLSKLDKLIKVFQNNKIKNDEIPLNIAQNIFDILSCVINKTLINNSFNNSKFFNNYNTNDPSSFLDENSGIFYNYIKPEKIYILYNEKYRIKFFHIINNNISIFFSNINNDILNYLSKNNIYIQINEIYKEAIKTNKNKIEILNDKIIWIPCFEIYNHFKCLSKNGVGTIHEYVKISNKKIKKMNFGQFRIKNNEKTQVKIEPDTSRDILFDNDFILGLINNAQILIDDNKNNKKNQEEINNNENNDEELPYIVFLSYIYKYNFMTKDNK